MSQKDSRISELESGRASDKKKLAALETQQKEQLHDRNALLLSLWTKLAALCGSDWQHQNSLVAGHYPTVDVVANKLPQFQQHLLHAVRTVEGTVGGFRARVRAVEHDLAKDYQQLEHHLDLRLKRLDRLESAVQVSRVAGAVHAAPEIARLRGENRLLTTELAQLRRQEQVRAARHHAVSIEGPPQPPATPRGDRPATPPAALPGSGPAGGPGGKARQAALLARHHSTTAVEVLQKQQQQDDPGRLGSSGTGSGAASIQSQPIEPSQQRWIHRLRELERRLKAEREARLLDRTGARQRLEESNTQNEELRLALEREKERQKMELA